MSYAVVAGNAETVLESDVVEVVVDAVVDVAVVAVEVVGDTVVELGVVVVVEDVLVDRDSC